MFPDWKRKADDGNCYVVDDDSLGLSVSAAALLLSLLLFMMNTTRETGLAGWLGSYRMYE